MNEFRRQQSRRPKNLVSACNLTPHEQALRKQLLTASTPGVKPSKLPRWQWWVLSPLIAIALLVVLEVLINFGAAIEMIFSGK